MVDDEVSCDIAVRSPLKAVDKGIDAIESGIKRSSNYHRFVKSYRKDMDSETEEFTNRDCDDINAVSTKTETQHRCVDLPGPDCSKDIYTYQPNKINRGDTETSDNKQVQSIQSDLIKDNHTVATNEYFPKWITAKNKTEHSLQQIMSTSCEHKRSLLKNAKSYHERMSQNENTADDDDQMPTEPAFDYMCYMGNRVPSKSFERLMQSMAKDGTPNTRAFRQYTCCPKSHSVNIEPLLQTELLNHPS